MYSFTNRELRIDGIIIFERRQAVAAFFTSYMGLRNWKFLYGNFPKSVRIAKELQQVEVRSGWIL